MAAVKPCKLDGCDEPKNLPSHFCYYHALDRMFIDDQVLEARKRREAALAGGKAVVAVVPSRDWPAGKRWCSGCQTMVPLDYVGRGKSRCKACDSAATYGAHIQRTYGLSYRDYLNLYEFQQGKCFICGKKPRTIRLAVDHDHVTNQVRGLLCSGERSCNHDVLGNIADLDMAKRIVIYLETPPYGLMVTGQPLPEAAGAKPWSPNGAPPGWGLLPGTREIMQRLNAEALERRAAKCWEGHYADKDFWRFPEGHEGPNDIFHAIPDRLEPQLWEVRLRLARERLDRIQAQRDAM